MAGGSAAVHCAWLSKTCNSNKQRPNLMKVDVYYYPCFDSLCHLFYFALISIFNI